MYRKQATELVALLTAAYPNWIPQKATLGLYVARLEEFEFEAGKEAVMHVLNSAREFCPPVGVITSHARLIQNRIRDNRKRLPAPALTEAERQANLARLRKIIRTVMNKPDPFKHVARAEPVVERLEPLFE